MTMKDIRILKTLIISILLMMISQTVYADIGPKPSLTIYVKNYKNQSYYLDVLTKGDRLKYSDYASHRRENVDVKNMPLYKYNEDGWMATHVREALLYGDLEGEYNEETEYMVHRFSYHEVPKTFKIIVQYEDGEIVVSNVINTKQFWSEVSLDLSTGKVSDIPHVSYSFLQLIFLIILTVIIELFIAILFKIKEYKIIIKVNILTQLILHFILLVTFGKLNCRVWYYEFYLLEILIVFIEFYFYRIYLKNYTSKKLFIYSVVANIITFVTGLIN